MRTLTIVPPTHVDIAWRDGASCLGEATKLVDEITADQLKLILSRGERILVRMDADDATVGWGTCKIDQLPNMRVLHICDLVAPHAHFEAFYDELKKMAEQAGCSRIRCAAQEAQGRLYRIKLGMLPVYTIYEIEV